MKPLRFFRTDEVTRLLTRASRCAATPVSLHPFAQGEEGLRIRGVGRCAACRYVARLKGAAAACRASRELAALDALRNGEPEPFFCHLGFACVAACALPGFILTFGPYSPAEESRSLESDATQGLAALKVEPDDKFREALADVRVIPAASVRAIAAWTVETIDALWHAAHDTELPAGVSNEPPPVPSTPRPRKRPHPPIPDPYQAAAIAAALAGGEQGQARALVRATLSESRSAGRSTLAAKRARLLALVSAVIEAAERAEVPAEACWRRLPALLDQAQRAKTDIQLVDAAMGLLGALKRKAERTQTPALGYVELNAIVQERLIDGITLNEVAARLGQHPTAITHRLQRKFGMSFTEYLGRLRIDKAKELLRRTRLSVSDVARRVGISDVSNFGKLFRKFESMTPLKYRERFGRK